MLNHSQIVTINKLAAIKRIKQKPKLKIILNAFVTDLIAATGEVSQPLYDEKTKMWQFFFPYAFPEMTLDILGNVEKLLSVRKIKLNHFLGDYLYEKNIVFYLSEDALETYFIMSKLIEE